MNKDELLGELSQKINTGELSRDELINFLEIYSFPAEGEAVNQEIEPEKSSHFSPTKMLYILGSIIVVTGIIFFVAQIWEDIGSFGRISVTLLFGLLMSAIASVLVGQRPEEKIGSVFHVIGGVLIPVGIVVTVYELDLMEVSSWPLVFVFGTALVFYSLLNLKQKLAILTFFVIANGTAFIYLFVEALVDGYAYEHFDLYAYLTMVISISYFLIARSFDGTWNKELVKVLYFFGSLGFLSAAFSQVFDSVFWSLFYFIVAIGGVYLSVHLKSRLILAMSTFFLIIHVGYITGKYFADSLGWPISLILLGFLFIGLGYGSVNIGKKYIN